MRTWDRDRREYVTGWRAWWAESKVVVGGLLGLAGVVTVALLASALGNGTWQW